MKYEDYKDEHVDHPPHYRLVLLKRPDDGSDPEAPEHYEVRDVINSLAIGYAQSGIASGMYEFTNAIKYVTRAPFKGGIKDIDKAIWCLTELKKIFENLKEGSEV